MTSHCTLYVLNKTEEYVADFVGDSRRRSEHIISRLDTLLLRIPGPLAPSLRVAGMRSSGPASLPARVLGLRRVWPAPGVKRGAQVRQGAVGPRGPREEKLGCGRVLQV